MTEANQTNEGDTQQPVDASTEATTDTEQQAEVVQDQQVSDETAGESETSEKDVPEGAPDKYEFNSKVADAPDELDPEVVNAFGDVVERTDYGNHRNQLNLFDNLNEVVEENITADDILDFLFGSNRKGDK